VGAAADGRGTLMGVAVGGAVEAWRYDMVRTVSLMGCNLILKD
jgi:hypothetical protein